MSDDRRQLRRGGALFVAAGAALWGTDAVLRAPLVSGDALRALTGGQALPASLANGLSSSAIVLAEHVILLVFALPVVLYFRQYFTKLGATQWLTLILIAWGGSGLATVLFTEGFKTGDPTTVILLQKVQPLFAISLARLMLREPFGRFFWPAFGVAMVGAYLISFGTLDPIWRLPQAQIQTAGLAIGAAILWGSATVFGRYVLADLPFTALTGARFLFALPFLLVLALAQGTAGQTLPGIAIAPISLVLVALGPGLLSLLLYYRGLTSTRASIATLAELAFPATAVVLNWLFLSRGVSATQIVGFILLWGAIILLDRFAAAPAPTTHLRPATAGLAGD